MIREIIIDKTDNFWIDNGIVALYKTLRSISEFDSKCKFVLSSDRLEINILSEDLDIVTILNHAKNEISKTYLKKTDNVGWIFKDESYEVYQKTDFKMHLKPFFAGKTPSIKGALLIPSTKESDLGGKGRWMTTEEYLLFEKFKKEKSPIIINNKKNNLEGKGYIDSPPKHEIGDNFTVDYLKSGNKSCVFCGKTFQKVDIVTGMNYPFLTGKSGELNFASNLNGKPSISALYSFISLFSFRNINYLLQDDLKNYFVLYDGNLKELSSFYNTIQSDISQLSKPDFCSFEMEIIGTVYETECLFNFLLSVYKQIKSRLSKDKRRDLLFNKRVLSMFNDGNIFKDVKEYTSISSLFDLFDAFEQSDNERNCQELFINIIRYFSQQLDGGKYDSTWRNRLCGDILSFRSIHKTIEWFLGEVKLKENKGNIIYLDKIIEIYNLKTQKDMKAEMVEI